MHSQQGHLFVVQADLTRLAADAFIIPCDGDGYVAGGWRPFVEPGKKQQASTDWFKPEGVEIREGMARLSPPAIAGSADGRLRPDNVLGVRVLVDTVTPKTIEGMVARALEAVKAVASEAESHGGRVVPLVALPIVGVGQGSTPVGGLRSSRNLWISCCSSLLATESMSR